MTTLTQQRDDNANAMPPDDGGKQRQEKREYGEKGRQRASAASPFFSGTGTRPDLYRSGDNDGFFQLFFQLRIEIFGKQTELIRNGKEIIQLSRRDNVCIVILQPAKMMFRKRLLQPGDIPCRRG